MFRCDICCQSSKPREQEHKHYVMRNVVKHNKKILGYSQAGILQVEEWDTNASEIAKELKACERCHELLTRPTDTGKLPEISQIMALFRKERNKDRAAPPYKMGQPRRGKLIRLPQKSVVAGLRRVDLGNGQEVIVPAEPGERDAVPSKKPRTKKQRKQVANGSVNKPVKPGINVTSKPSHNRKK